MENTPSDIYEFSIILEDALVDEYDVMHEEQPRNRNIEYDKALEAVI